MIIDVTIVIVLWCHKQLSYMTANLTDKCGVWSDCSADQPSLSLSFSSGLSIPWDTTILKLGQLIALPWPLSVQVKGRVAHLSL